MLDPRGLSEENCIQYSTTSITEISLYQIWWHMSVTLASHEAEVEDLDTA